MPFSIATWNVNSIKIRLDQVLQWLQANPVDVLALQETKCIDENFPQAAFNEIGYQTTFSGQKTYNGVALISKIAAKEIITALPDFTDDQKRVLAATIGKTRILNLYVPNGASVDSDKYQYKLNWLAKLIAFTESQLMQYSHVILLGDFNIAPEDRDVHDPAKWQGEVLVSPQERQAFHDLLQTGLADSYRLFDHEKQEFSWWDYRRFAFKRNAGLRIDHILVSKPLATHCQQVSIDAEPRKAERPSDHTPVVAEFDLPL